ncbi:hypothetical protein [Natrinema zhouii]|uniref:hypothetical protein n=1 Tax=Natrinema zhouii TaxID=1710539 RepID=UPI003CE580BD
MSSIRSPYSGQIETSSAYTSSSSISSPFVTLRNCSSGGLWVSAHHTGCVSTCNTSGAGAGIVWIGGPSRHRPAESEMYADISAELYALTIPAIVGGPSSTRGTGR